MEMDLISAAFKAVIAIRRTPITKLQEFMKKTDWGYPESVDLAQDQVKKIEGEIITVCESIISVVD